MIRRPHIGDLILIGYGVAMIALAWVSVAANPASALRAADPLDLRSLDQRLDAIEMRLDVIENRLRVRGEIVEPAPRRWIKG